MDVVEYALPQGDFLGIKNINSLINNYGVIVGLMT